LIFIAFASLKTLSKLILTASLFSVLFISSLAWEQREHFDIDETKKRNLDNFRTYVGIHLSNYLQENDIRISKDTINEFESNLVKEPDAT